MISGNYLDVHAFPVEKFKRLPGVLTDGILQDNPVERLYLFRQRRFVFPLHRDIAHNDNPAALFQQYAVFARVTPGQKKELVCALKRQGHQVAMTGDGVNDLLALREADCSIAVADGSDASRQIAQVVLLDSDFTNLPQVVMEGRKVVNNVTRTASVFFIKTIYSVQ